MNIPDSIFENLILTFFDADPDPGYGILSILDPGYGMKKIGSEILDLGFGIVNITDPQHC